MTYPEVIQYLKSFIDYEKIPTFAYKESLKLERIKGFLQTIGNPQNRLKCLHIAGSKGKGSTCAFLTYILREAGYSVGLYTSPHLSDFRERIRILMPNTEQRTPNSDFEGMITKKELAGLLEKMRPAIEKYSRVSQYGPLSFFEVYTALAFLYFQQKKVDFAVLETGLGGRLDATNVVDPLVCAITPISYEHTQKLGNTLAEIAREKAGIIKTHRAIVINAPQKDEALKVIRKRCKEFGAKLYQVHKPLINLKTRLLGRHQLVNAAVAVNVIKTLEGYGFNVSVEAIKRGLYNTLWPGRCEVVSKNPLIVLDGAQNVASSKVLKETIKENFKYKRLILVLGISSDKDIKGICNELYDLADIVILTKADNPRATKPKKLAEYFKDKDIYITDNVKSARIKARELAKKEDLILVTGSLFVVGEFRNAKR